MQLFPIPPMHKRACMAKQMERKQKIESLSPAYFEPFSVFDSQIHGLPLSELVTQCRFGSIQPSSILMAYTKKALHCHEVTNCLSDLMLESALATPPVANWEAQAGEGACIYQDIFEPSLLGVPIGIKDTIDVSGHDSTIGFSKNIGRPAPSSAAIVRLLQDQGALLHVKTTVPTGLLALETVSDVFGRTTNPYSRNHTAGASTGGGAALLACGGSKIEIGTDIAGSVRIPAHFCGIWSLKGSSGRFPTWGSRSSTPGLESIPIVVSPMASNLPDLREFCQRVITASPWLYDHTCVPLPWQNLKLQEEGRKLKWGVIWDDGVIPPTPACKRALLMAVAALQKLGHEVVDFDPPQISEGLEIGYQLLFSDGGSQIRNALQQGEQVTTATKAILDLLGLPRFYKKALSFLMHLNGSESSQLHDMHTKTILQDRENVVARDRYRAEWHKEWTEHELDFVLTVPIAFPALRNNDSEKATLMSAGYTFLFSLLDYSAGVMPVTHVNKALDRLPKSFASTEEYKRLSTAAKGAYSAYDAETMHGLPVGIQVIGRRLEEEKVLEGMEIVETALREFGAIFVNGVHL